MRKLKKGDPFVVVSEPSCKYWNSAMNEYCGKTLTVAYDSPSDRHEYVVIEDGKSWSWFSEYHIDWDATEELYTPKNMLRSDDVVKDRCGEELTVFIAMNAVYHSGGKQKTTLDWFRDDLTSMVAYRYDIISIRRGNEIIWERPTMSEKDKEIQRIEKEMHRLANDLSKLKEVHNETK